MHGATWWPPETLRPSGVTMGVLNRSAAVIKPRQPYLDWAKRDDTTGVAELVFETLRREPHVYLVPEHEDAESEQAVLEKYWPHLFEAMLAGWLTDERQWPKQRTRTMFQEWFDVQMCSVVEDLHLEGQLIELV